MMTKFIQDADEKVELLLFFMELFNFVKYLFVIISNYLSCLIIFEFIIRCLYQWIIGACFYYLLLLHKGQHYLKLNNRQEPFPKITLFLNFYLCLCLYYKYCYYCYSMRSYLFGDFLTDQISLIIFEVNHEIFISFLICFINCFLNFLS